MLCLTRSWSLTDLLVTKRLKPHEAVSRRGGMHENFPSTHRGRPESLCRHRILPEDLGDTEPGWNDGLPPGGHLRAGRVVVGRGGHPGPEILPEVGGAAGRRR